MNRSAFVVALVVAFVPAAAFAETRAADVKAWLCERVPSWKRCARHPEAPVPLPPAKPAEIVPAPEVAPAPPPVLVWPEPPRFEVLPDQVPPQAAPELPKVEPKADPPKQADRSRLRKRIPPKRERPQTPAENDGSWLAPCWMVCNHVRGKSKAQLDADEIYWRVTPYQKAHGERCIRSTCPDAFPKR